MIEADPHPLPLWLRGLPVDPVTLEDATQRVRDAVDQPDPLVFATPNLNFLRTAREDPVFQESVLRTGLSLADGTPLLWLARLQGTPLPERVAGSSLVERLRNSTLEPPLRVCFLGGPPGVAEQASRRLAEEDGGLTGVGGLDPGQGSVDALGRPELFEALARAAPDFLIVALGARKGHLWIERHRERLAVPVISHLGAVVNFVAGTIRRAPPAWQRFGLEWVWRIREEPTLARRYLRDGLFLLGEVARALLHRRRAPGPPSAAVHASDSGLSVTGLLDAKGARRLAGALRERAGTAVLVDLGGATGADPAGFGALYWARYRREPGARLVGASHALRAAARAERAEVLLAPAD